MLNQDFATTTLIVGAATTPVAYAVQGATVGMGVTVNVRSAGSLGPLLYAWVSATNTVSVDIKPLVAVAAATVKIDIHVIP